jgi:predicted  nucleic acid-binding Zn-ribbon protein
LRRDEFVALNTWQIQKLKPRMTEAEERIYKLEQELAELKSRLI